MPLQGNLSIERMCELTRVSRASFYRSFHKQQPVEEELELRAPRKQRGRTQGYIAEHLGMDRSFISDLENGRKVQVGRNWTMEQVSQKAGANDNSGRKILMTTAETETRRHRGHGEPQRPRHGSKDRHDEKSGHKSRTGWQMSASPLHLAER